ncbi:MAG: AAA family ATPase [Oligoflexia bacterium]|nr:AAA family ATPase [Oligoflexia bacterium]
MIVPLKKHAFKENKIQIAIKICECLQKIHQKKIIHTAINPYNIFYNDDTEEIDLNKDLSKDVNTNLNINNIHELQYISPEQTGRINQSLDYRSDFYSLGMTLYELFTGKDPFNNVSNDTLEIINLHLTKYPTKPDEIDSSIPIAISNIIMKLISKHPSERYQSIYGLLYDLNKCSQLYEEFHRQLNGHAMIDFPIGKKDCFDRLEISTRLYGREEYVQKLQTLFKECCKKNDNKVLLISGYSGIGKSSVVKELHKFVNENNGYFISGKFEQLKKSIPYAPIIQAFQEYVKKILMEKDDRIAYWKKKIQRSLGNIGQVVVDVIPQLELIIGKQPAISQLNSIQTQNRFNLVFQNFIQSLSTPDSPLVIFLDDLQWADYPSLKLINLFITNKDIKNFFFIGAYRDNEVDKSHPLFSILKEISNIENIKLNEISIEDINCLVADSLKSDISSTKPLAHFCYKKTGGNPLFAIQFLKSIYDENLIRYDYDTHNWCWDLLEIEKKEVSSNIVELLTKKLFTLPTQTRDCLKLAACLGNKFDIETLSIIYEKSIDQTKNDLLPAFSDDLILALNNTNDTTHYEVKFLHDKVQQSTYALIDSNEYPKYHLKIGRLLLKRALKSENVEDKVFDIVNHFNIGGQLITEQNEIKQLIKLNLQAGNNARRSNAYDFSFSYYKRGIELLLQINKSNNSNPWNEDYDLIFDLQTGAIESAYLNGDFNETYNLIESTLPHLSKIHHKVLILEIKIKALQAQDRRLDAVDIFKLILKEFKLEFPQNPTLLHVLANVLKTKSKLFNKSISDIQKLPVVCDVNTLDTLRLFNGVFSSLYIASPNLLLIASCNIINKTLQYGNNEHAGRSYLVYMMIMCSLGDIKSAIKWRDVYYMLSEKYDIAETRASNILYKNLFCEHYDKPLRITLEQLQHGYLTGLETGDFEFAALSLYILSDYSFWSGLELKKLQTDMQNHSNIMKNLKQYTYVSFNNIVHQNLLNLSDINNDNDEKRDILTGSVMNEEEVLKDFLQKNNKSCLSVLYINKVALSMFFGLYKSGLENYNHACKYKDAAVSSITEIVLFFYGSLILLADENQTFFRRIEAKINLKKLRDRAKYSPQNFLHKCYLIEAELARTASKWKKAEEFYDLAIDLAAQNEYLQEEALSYELAGIYYLKRSRNKIAYSYLNIAKEKYQLWGAEAKVLQLNKRYPFLLAKGFHTKQDKQESANLDLVSIVKASQDISSEVVFSKLLHKLILLICENAHAKKGLLFLVDELSNKLLLQAKIEDEHAEVMQNQDIFSNTQTDVPVSIIQYVFRGRESVILKNASASGDFIHDPVVYDKKLKSILCIPVLNQGKVLGVIYLENNLSENIFTEDRITVLKILSAQTAVSVTNSRIYQNLEKLVNEKSALLNEKNEHIRFMFQNIKQGIFSILPPKGIVHSEYSTHLQEILETTQIAEENVDELLFLNSNLSSDDINQIKSVINSCLGGSELNFKLNKTKLPKEYVKNYMDGKSKTLELDWNPIIQNKVIVKIMITIRDVTALRKLQKLAQEKEEELEILSQLLSIPHTQSREFFNFTKNLLSDSETNKQNLKRNLHTIKGMARQCRFEKIKDLAHQSESDLQNFNKLQTLINKYEKIFNDKLKNLNVTEEKNTTSSTPISISIAEIISNNLQDLSVLSKRLGKEIPEVKITDNGLQITNGNIIISLKSIFLHLFTNSIEHGIETPDERLKKGKKPVGNISIELFKSTDDDHYQLIFKDDGRGVDLNKIKDIAAQKGLISSDSINNLSDNELVELIFLPGFTTSKNISDISGRGVGMDAVKETIKQLGGDIHIELQNIQDADNKYNKEIAFVIKLPLTNLSKF